MHVTRLAKSYETFFWKEIDFIIWRADGRGRYGNHRKYWELDAISSNFSSNSDAYMRPYGPMHQFLYSTWNIYHRGHPSYHLQKGSHQLEANICTENCTRWWRLPDDQYGNVGHQSADRDGTTDLLCSMSHKAQKVNVICREQRVRVCLRGKSGVLLRCFSLWKEDSGDMKKRFFDLK